MVDEKELVQRILAGNDQAFGVLVEQYERLVFHIIRRVVAQEQDVEDVCQEVFLKVHRHLKGFSFEARLATWIARIAYLTAINYARRYRRVTPQDLSLVTKYDPQPNPHQALENQETAAYVNTLINQLPPVYRTVLTLYHIQAFSYEEIGQITGQSASMVKSNLFRGRKLLKDKVTAYLNGEIE